MSRSETSRDVNVRTSSESRFSGRSPLRSTSVPPCGLIRRSVATVVLTPSPRLPAAPRPSRDCAQGRTPRFPRAPLPVTAWARSCGHRRTDQAELLEPGDDDVRALLRLVLLGVEDDLGRRRLLVRIVDAGEALDLA